MKKFEVVISGEHETEIGHEILVGIYAAVQNYGTRMYLFRRRPLKSRETMKLQIPEF